MIPILPVFWWRFDDGLGTEAMGTGLSLTSLGCVEEGESSLGAALGGSWDSGDALACGLGQRAIVQDDPALDLDPITVALWYRSEDPDQCDGWCAVLTRGSGDLGIESGLKVGTSPSAGLEVSIGDGSLDSFVYGPALPDDTWSFLTAVWDDPTMTMYVDGAAVEAATLPGLAWGPDALIVGGMLDRTYAMGGRTDELLVFDRALSDGEVAALYGFYTDADADGANADDDCDPSRGDVYPGAAEVADDGVDQDCLGGDLLSGTTAATTTSAGTTTTPGIGTPPATSTSPGVDRGAAVVDRSTAAGCSCGHALPSLGWVTGALVVLARRRSRATGRPSRGPGALREEGRAEHHVHRAAGLVAAGDLEAG